MTTAIKNGDVDFVLDFAGMAKLSTGQKLVLKIAIRRDLISYLSNPELGLSRKQVAAAVRNVTITTHPP